MFTVYIDKICFENIVLYNEKTPNWHKIMTNHADVCLNMTDEELQQELIQGTIIFEFINAYGGKEPIALAPFFETINEKPETIADKPKAAFILDIDSEKAKTLQSNYGVIVMSGSDIKDEILNGPYFIELETGQVVENEGKLGWQKLFKEDLPPLNAIVMTDDYLFSNEENSKNVGVHNILNLLDSIMPHRLNTLFHIFILTGDLGKNLSKEKSNEKCNMLFKDLNEKIKNLRTYEVVFELVFADAPHKRKLFTNYLSITCDRGFAMFRVKDSKTLRNENDFRLERLFDRQNSTEGDTVCKSDYKRLKSLKEKCEFVKNEISKSGEHINFRILGDCKPDKSIRNRLINDI
jgi:hypothetical protein